MKEGDPLFELDKKPYEEKLAAAKGMLAEAKAALTKSNMDVARLTPLVAQNAVPQKDLDNAVASVEVGRGQCGVRRGAGEIGGAGSRLLRRQGADRGTHRREGGARSAAWSAKASRRCWPRCRRSIRSGSTATISEVDFLQAERLATEAGRKMGELPVHLILADGTEHPEPGKWVFIDRVVDATTATIRARAEFPNPAQGASSRACSPGSASACRPRRATSSCRSAR